MKPKSYEEQLFEKCKDEFPIKCPECFNELTCAYVNNNGAFSPLYLCYECGMYSRLVQDIMDYVVYVSLCFKQMKKSGDGLYNH